MVKKACGALLLTVLPLSAVLVGCSDSSAAEDSMPENAGTQSKMESSAPLPPVPSDAELQQSTDPDTDPSLTEPTGSTPPHSSIPSNPRAAEDPYLPPQAYIPPSSPSSSSTAPSKTTTPSPTTEAVDTASDRVSSPKPSKPIPLLPEDDSEDSKSGLPQEGGNATAAPKPPSAEVQPQPGTAPLSPSEPSQKAPSSEQRPSRGTSSPSASQNTSPHIENSGAASGASGLLGTIDNGSED
ncbi:hypothetical protein [uncultured Corynebacterium sp.]|uniref:hypothetical protein n=1 Tax=uncultured Corynebacterium sp. TaxID=159447 RepID=UPI00261945D8|nr:hypothetical protein [uncultured Corynebacterium sp.]